MVSLLSVEGVIRLVEPHLSRDLAQLRNLPKVAEQLRQHQGAKVLVMGNSLTRQAIDTPMLTAGLKASGRPNPGVFFFVPDGTNMRNWDYGLARYFLYPGALPDELFIGTGLLHLHDTFGDASRLAGYYVDNADLARVWREDLLSWEEKCEFAMSRLSRVHASRRRIKPHVFGRLIPHYFDVEQWINTQRLGGDGDVGSTSLQKPSLRHLAHLLEACRQRGIRVTFFSIPLPEHYEIAPATIAAVKAGGGIWLPLADMPGLSAADFPDGYHLNTRGAGQFTARLVESLPTWP